MADFYFPADGFSFAWFISDLWKPSLEGIPSGCPSSLNQEHQHREKESV
jgi:hypothetical protein